MRRSSLLVLLAGFLVLAAGLWLHLGRRPAPAPMTEAERQQADLMPSSEFLNAAASISHYERRVRATPDDVDAHVALAQLYLQQAKARGEETTYVPRARKALAEALRRDPESYHARALEASLLNTLHRFEEAEAAVRRLMTKYPDVAYLHGVLVDALVEQGKYAEAVRAADEMQRIRPDLGSYSRVSYLRELHGDSDGAIAAMRLAADAGAGGHESRAWALYELGNLYLGQGDTARAEMLFRGILEERASFWRALIGLGRVRLVQGRTAEAVTLMQQAHDEAPGAFDALDGLAAAYDAAGDTRKSADVARRLRAAFEAADRMGERNDMELADFLADEDQDLPRVLQMARAEVERRPGHLHANETYAWALHKNGRAKDAIPYIERAMRLNTGDAMVHFRAARIYEAAGDRTTAATHFQKALDGHLEVESVTAAAEARAALGRAPVAARTEAVL